MISGDYNQSPAMDTRISEKYNYARNPAIYELCNFNKIELTKCRRADDTLFNLTKFDNVPNLTPQHFNISSKVTDYDVHLCYTNKKKNTINDAMMESKKIIYDGPSLILKKIDKQPPVILQIDTIVVYKEDKERFKIIKIKDNIVTIQSEN